MPSTRKALFQQYDLTDTSNYVYGLFGDLRPMRKPVKTTGSSATVDEVTSGDNPFDEVDVASEIVVVPGADATAQVRFVAAKASGAQITIDSAANWENSGNGRHASFRKFFSGTTASDGWFGVRSMRRKTLIVTVHSFNATSLLLRVEGRIKGSQGEPALILARTYTAVTLGDSVNFPIEIAEGVDEIRVGWKHGGADAGANKVSVYFVGEEYS